MYYIGIVAVACVHNYDCDERIELYSKLLLEHSLILIWSFVDPIHPQVQFILYMYVCVCYICLYVHTHMSCVYMGVCICMYIYMCVCMHVCVHIHACMFMCIYIPYLSV